MDLRLPEQGSTSDIQPRPRPWKGLPVIFELLPGAQPSLPQPGSGSARTARLHHQPFPPGPNEAPAHTALQHPRQLTLSADPMQKRPDQGCQQVQRTSLPSSSVCGGFSMTTVCTALPGWAVVAPWAVPDAPCPAQGSRSGVQGLGDGYTCCQLSPDRSVIPAMKPWPWAASSVAYQPRSPGLYQQETSAPAAGKSRSM